MWRTFLEVFLPLFVALDPIGMVPLFLSVTGGMNEPERKRVAIGAVGAAAIIAVIFMFVGQVIFDFLGIKSADFRIAGGILLLVFAVMDILVAGKSAVHEPEIVGIVPLATPLIAGPATLTTILVLSSQPRLGHSWTAAGLLVNLVILAVALWFSSGIARLIGRRAMSAVSKVVTILLAAIAVTFIRTGVEELIRAWKTM